MIVPYKNQLYYNCHVTDDSLGSKENQFWHQLYQMSAFPSKEEDRTVE